MKLRALGAAAGLAVTLVAPAALSDPTDLFGFGARGPAQGNAMVASHDALASPVYNVAAGAMTERPQAGAGYLYAKLSLDIDGRDANLINPHGVWGSLVVPIKIGTVNLAGAIALHVPDQFVLRIYSTPATQPRLVMWDNQPNRIVTDAAISARFGETLAVGAGVMLLGDAEGQVNFKLGSAPGRTVSDASMDTQMPIRSAPMLGVLYTPTKALSIGARYREPVAVHVGLDVNATSSIEGTSLNGTTVVKTVGLNYYSPREVALGVSLHPDPWRFEADLVWQQWSQIPQVTFDVTVQANLGIDTPVFAFPTPPPGWHDVWVPHVGAERRFDLGSDRAISARAGYWYAKSPVPEQTGLTNYGDSDRHVITAGTGFRFLDVGIPLSADIAFQVQLLKARENHKSDLVQPGGGFTNGGHVTATIFGVSAEL